MPTLLTTNVYPKLLGGQTELWRAYRRYAGVMMFPYLSTSSPGGFTADQFVDIKRLTLEPHMAAALEQAFRPSGVYLSFWRSEVQAATAEPMTVYMVNEEAAAANGTLHIGFVDASGREAAQVTVDFFCRQQAC